MEKEEKEFETNQVSGFKNQIVFKHYKDLCYNSDYTVDTELTEKEYQERLEKVRELQEKNRQERLKARKESKEVDLTL